MARFGHCDPIYIIKGSRRFKTEASFSNTLTIFSTLTLGDGCGRLQDSTASSRRWLAPSCFIWSECNHKFLRSGRGSTSWYGAEETYFLSIPRFQIWATYRVKKEHYNDIHWPAETCRPSRQTETYSILILYAGYTMNSSRPTHGIFTYLKIVLSLVGPLLRTSWNNVSQMPSALPNNGSYFLLDRRQTTYSWELKTFTCALPRNCSCRGRAPLITYSNIQKQSFIFWRFLTRKLSRTIANFNISSSCQ